MPLSMVLPGCAAAQANQILASEVARDLDASPDTEFRPLGEFTLKGFSKSFALYDVSC